MYPTTDLTIKEKADLLEVLMGALSLPFYPPSGKWTQINLQGVKQKLPVKLESLRRELGALDAPEFQRIFREVLNPLRADGRFFGPLGGSLAAYGAALVASGDPEPEYLHCFENMGYDANKVVFMALLLENILKRMGEPQRCEFEKAIVNLDAKNKRLGVWAQFLAAQFPARLVDKLGGVPLTAD